MCDLLNVQCYASAVWSVCLSIIIWEFYQNV